MTYPKKGSYENYRRMLEVRARLCCEAHSRTRGQYEQISAEAEALVPVPAPVPAPKRANIDNRPPHRPIGRGHSLSSAESVAFRLG